MLHTKVTFCYIFYYLYHMSIEKAVNDLLNSKEFKDAARQDAKLRVYAGRIKKEGVKLGVALELLIRFGYTIQANKARKNK